MMVDLIVCGILVQHCKSYTSNDYYVASLVFLIETLSCAIGREAGSSYMR